MATERLIVKNFGPIQEADLDLRKVTVLIGPQASGKSVLSKLVAIFANLLLDSNNLSSAWKLFNLENFIQKDSTINYSSLFFENTLDSQFAKKIKDDSLEASFQEYERNLEQWRKNRTLLQENPKISQEERQKNRIIRDEILSQRQSLISLMGGARYIPAERALVSVLSKVIFQLVDNDIKLPQFLTDFLSDYEIIRGSSNQFDIDFLGISYAFRDGKDKVILKENREIELSESATGFQTAIPMVLLIESLQKKGKHRFIIEEPELNLYPTTQKKLVEYLVEKCTKGDNRLIITTHSPYILTALNNCIEANNVLKTNPEAKATVDKLVPPESQIAYEDVAAYFVANGKVRSIMNDEYQIIDANALDDVSDELSRVHGELLDLKYQHQD